MTTPNQQAAELAAERYGAEATPLTPAERTARHREQRATITVTMPPFIKAQLIALAERRGQSQTETVRQLIADAAAKELETDR